jgi:hypothetical protein
MKSWTIRTDPESVEWERRVRQHYPLSPRHRLLRLALRYGLRSAALQPELLVEEAACTDSDVDEAPCTDATPGPVCTDEGAASGRGAS